MIEKIDLTSARIDQALSVVNLMMGDLTDNNGPKSQLDALWTIQTLLEQASELLHA